MLIRLKENYGIIIYFPISINICLSLLFSFFSQQRNYDMKKIEHFLSSFINGNNLMKQIFSFFNLKALKVAQQRGNNTLLSVQKDALRLFRFLSLNFFVVCSASLKNIFKE